MTMRRHFSTGLLLSLGFAALLAAGCGQRIVDTQQPTCGDGLKDQNETDVDCGGVCGPCAANRGCAAPTDCVSKNCPNLTCAPAVCNDSIVNGDESDMDCGGSCTMKCVIGKMCSIGSDCQSGVCEAGACASPSCHDDLKNGSETDVDCGGGMTSMCAPCGTGEHCMVKSDCNSNQCSGGKCVAATCTDKILNGNESDIDCGGPDCLACSSNLKCNDDTDCASFVCNNNVCALPSCTDGIMNGGETDVDCGGNNCPKCDIGLGCQLNRDCISAACPMATHICNGGSCTDMMKDGNETDVDCGGDTCAPCPSGLICNNNSDCASQICTSGTPSGSCAAPSCTDGVQNGSETDVDCGGTCAAKCGLAQMCMTNADCKVTNPAIICVTGVCAAKTCTATNCGGTNGCPPCPDNAPCKSTSDCQSQLCSGGTCSPASCTDGLKNGAETDVDCGGGMTSTCMPCVVGKKCLAGGDCSTGVCTNGLCVAASCTDGLKNGDETDIDCGGSCQNCATGHLCKVAMDCASSVCTNGKCSSPTCGDKVKNGNETDTDCGGSCGATCTATPPQMCNTAKDCATGVCTSGTCANASCSDGIKNQKETDVDCGGSCMSCPLGRACVKASDCTSKFCKASTCQIAVSCNDLKKADATLTDGVFTIDTDGAGPIAPFQVYCDMTSDGGGWTLMATLKTTDTISPASLGGGWTNWSPDWFIINHGNATDPSAGFTNHTAKDFAPLVTSGTVLRASDAANQIRRYMFGFLIADWTLWGTTQTGPSGMTTVGPFNLANVQVSKSPQLDGPKPATENGPWTTGRFFLGTALSPTGTDSDGEGLGLRFHVGSTDPSRFGYAGDQLVQTTWNLYLK